MGEEGKKKKLVYEQPRLVKLSSAKGAGFCAIGSGDIDCFSGNAATFTCTTGSGD
ncbi:MAG TPA: hypothetical protein ACFYD6_01100 [Candidatus Brocadiia bacterium]|nr:hypothetical protein [Candidatus Brocadiales bacterium]